jgi:hypothetical protein
MIAAIAAALAPGISLGPTAPSALSDIFEAYIWALVVLAAKSEGANVHYEDVSQTPVTSLVFRTSPGQIYSTAHAYTHAVIDFPQRPPLEAHIGVMIAGKSGVLHEADVMVVRRAEALTCRREGVPPVRPSCYLQLSANITPRCFS